MSDTFAGRLCCLRPYRSDDAAAICAVADDFLVARWMTRAFPHPYSLADAQRWVAHATGSSRNRYFAVEVEGKIAGGIGIEPYGAEREGCAAFGYWLGRDYWGRGIATDAALTLSDAALRGRQLRRLEARVFAPNIASARVLEKSGFTLEGRLRAYYLDRENKVCDALSYVRFA